MRLAESTLRRIIREEIIALNEMDFVFHDEGEKPKRALAKFTIEDVNTGKNVVYPTPNQIIFNSTVANAKATVSSRSATPKQKKSAQSIIDDFENCRRNVNPGEDKFMYVYDPEAVKSIEQAIANGSAVDNPWNIQGFSRSLRRDSTGYNGTLLQGQVEMLSSNEKESARDLGTLKVRGQDISQAPSVPDYGDRYDTGDELPGAKGMRHLDMRTSGGSISPWGSKRR